jgi:hypothetical protein
MFKGVKNIKLKQNNKLINSGATHPTSDRGFPRQPTTVLRIVIDTMDYRAIHGAVYDIGHTYHSTN